MIYLLLVILILNLWISYRYFGNIASPSFLFNIGFFFCSLVAILYIEEWSLYKINSNTFWVLLSGCVSFTIISIMMHFYQRKKILQCKNEIFFERIPVLTKKFLFFFLIFQCVIYGIYARYLMELFSTNDLVTAILQYNSTVKFNKNEVVKIPFSIIQPVFFCYGTCYVFAFLYIKSFLYKVGNNKWLLANIILGSLGMLLSGGREGMLVFLFMIALAFYILWQKKNKWKKAISMKIKLIIMAGLFLGGLSFQLLGVMVGRKSSDESGVSPFYYAAIYCGAQIKNLDIYLSQRKIEHSKKWGEQTFYNGYWSKIYAQKGIRFEYDLPFQFNNGYPLGNVYTTFYAWIYDFGYGGILPCIFFMALIAHSFYQKMKQSSCNQYEMLYVIIYSYIAFTLFFSFFANKFYGKIITAAFIRNCLVWFFWTLFLKQQKYTQIDIL